MIDSAPLELPVLPFSRSHESIPASHLTSLPICLCLTSALHGAKACAGTFGKRGIKMILAHVTQVVLMRAARTVGLVTYQN